MKTICFVCHGNICRSVAAEFIMKSKTNDFEIFSRATSTEEIGNDIYPPMKLTLKSHNIPFSRHQARQINYQDYQKADYIFYMDSENLFYLNRMFPSSSKIFPIFAYTPGLKQIEDPWYTGNFDIVVNQINRCIDDILENIK